MYFTKATVQRAVRDMRGAADHMLKIWFVLKAMGLTKTHSVTIDTSNSTPYLQKLFKSGNADGSFFVPFAHTERFAKMKNDAARSIIQTNIQRWASSGSVVSVDPILVDGLQLRPCLQHQAGGDLAASNRSHQLLQIGDLPNVCCLIDQAPNMNRKPAAVNVICLLTEQVEELSVDQIRKLKVASVSDMIRNSTVFRSPMVSSSSSS